MKAYLLFIIPFLLLSSSFYVAHAQQSTNEPLDSYCQYQKKLDPNFVCPIIPQHIASGAAAKNILKNDQGLIQSEINSQSAPQYSGQNSNPTPTQIPKINGSQGVTAGIVIFVLIIIVIAIGKRNRGPVISSKIEQGLQTNFRHWGSREFEELAADLYRKKGYQTELTSKGPDQGIDVIAVKGKERIVIQTKCWQNKVSNTDVLKTVGAREMAKATKAVVITNSDFTPNAREVERNTPGLELINMDKLRDEIKKSFKTR